MSEAIRRQYAYFSAAIRAGIKMFPAVHGPYLERNAKGEVCGTCAIGAGMVALGLGECSADVCRAFPYMVTRTACPVDNCCERLSHSSLLDIAIILFEEHDWTREAVADWLYSEEEKLGFVTLISTQDERDTRGINRNQGVVVYETESVLA